MNFAFSDEQEELRNIVRSFLEKKSAEADVREQMETEKGFDDAVWTQMAEQMGLQSLIIPEEFGGSGYSYVQDWLSHVGQAVVRGGDVDVVGLGRMILSYPHLAADTLAGTPFDRRLVCRTFSDCTTAPRNGLVSGCYPLDPHYKDMPARVTLAKAKRALREERR